MKRLVVLLSAYACMTVASAQTLYRCGPDGRDYSQTPCADGQRVEVTNVKPSPADVAAARDAAKRDAKLAEQLHRENEGRKAQQPVAGAAGIHGIPAPVPASAASKPVAKKKKTKHKEKSEEDFTAVVPQPSKPKKP